MKNKLTLFLSIGSLLFISMLYSQKLNVNNEKRILVLIRNINTEKEAANIFNKLEQFGTSALPYIIEGMKEKKVYVQKYSIITLGSILQRRCRGKVKLGKMSFKKFDFLTPEEKTYFNQAFEILLFLSNSQRKEIRRLVACYLGLFGDQRAVPVLEKLLKDPDNWVRYESYQSLWLMGYKKYDFIKVMTGKECKTLEDFITILSKDTSPFGIYRIAERQIIRKFNKKSIPVLIKIAKGNKEPARQRAIALLGQLQAEEAIPIFENYLKEETRNETMYKVQLSCIGALIEMDTEESINTLLEYGLRNKNPKIRYYTAEKLLEANKIEKRYPTLEKIVKERKGEIKELLKELGKKGSNDIKYKVAILLIREKEKEGIDILIGLLRDREYFGMAKGWLEDITGQKFGGIPPVVSKKMLEEYIGKWERWWKENRETFKFP